jgi:hypothetical protein
LEITFSTLETTRILPTPAPLAVTSASPPWNSAWGRDGGPGWYGGRKSDAFLECVPETGGSGFGRWSLGLGVALRVLEDALPSRLRAFFSVFWVVTGLDWRTTWVLYAFVSATFCLISNFSLTTSKMSLTPKECSLIWTKMGSVAPRTNFPLRFLSALESSRVAHRISKVPGSTIFISRASAHTNVWIATFT